MSKGRKTKDWEEYPIGTKAYAIMGGYWIRVKNGWKWYCGDTFPSPGGDANGWVDIPESDCEIIPDQEVEQS